MRLYGFVVDADATRLSTLYERMFSVPSEGQERYSPAGPWILIVVADIRHLASAAADRALGYVTEKEVSIWAPALDDSRGGRLVWTVPYMFVDSAHTLAGGRETYGYPKQLGHISIEGPESRPDAINLYTDSFAVFHPDAAASPQSVLSIRRPSIGRNGSDPDPMFSAGGLPQLLLRFRQRLFGLTAVRELLDQLTTSRVPMILLKQFRSCEDSRFACYQAIVEVAHLPAKVRAAGLLPDDYRIALRELESQPIERELGISSQSPQPRLGFWLDFDFVVESGTVLWQSQQQGSRAT